MSNSSQCVFRWVENGNYKTLVTNASMVIYESVSVFYYSHKESKLKMEVVLVTL